MTPEPKTILPDEIKTFIEAEALKWARDHSAAPDKETPDWIITDFTAGATSLYQHLQENGE